MSFFKDATYRLTFLYVLILFFLSFSYSTWLYFAAGNEINWITNIAGEADRIVSGVNASNDSKERLLQSLIFFNLFVLGAGMLVSYALARHTLKPIQKSYEAQANFAMYASHELRTPLTALKAELQLAQRGVQTSQAMQRTIQSSLDEVDRLSHLTGRLLRLTDPVSNDINKQNASLCKAITTATKALSIIKEKEIHIKQPEHDVHLAITTNDIVEVLTIILHNAAKYSPSKSQVNITYKTHGKLCEIRISDSGPGISSHDLPYIFDPFYRASATKNQAGSGLGLAIAKNILTHAGCSINVASTKGTTIILQIPIHTSV